MRKILSHFLAAVLLMIGAIFFLPQVAAAENKQCLLVLKDEIDSNGKTTKAFCWDMVEESPCDDTDLYSILEKDLSSTDCLTNAKKLNTPETVPPTPPAPALPNGAGAAPPAGPTGPTEISGSNGIMATFLKEKYENSEVLNNYKGPLPKCAFSGTCRRTNDLLILLINIGKYLFSIIGTVALAAFIYGGFMMIFSFGNAEKVKAGRDAMVAAVVGLIIAFSAYLIINFVLDALQVNDAFRGLLK